MIALTVVSLDRAVCQVKLSINGVCYCQFTITVSELEKMVTVLSADLFVSRVSSVELESYFNSVRVTQQLVLGG